MRLMCIDVPFSKHRPTSLQMCSWLLHHLEHSCWSLKTGQSMSHSPCAAHRHSYTPHGDPDSGAESSGGWSDGGGGSGSSAVVSRNSADLSAYNSADLDAHPSASGSGVQISELDLLPAGGSSR